MERQEELLFKCIGYIQDVVNSYSETIDVFKRLGFTEKELLDYEIRDLYLEEELENMKSEVKENER